MLLRGPRDVRIRIGRRTLDAFVDDEREGASETVRVERVRAGAYNRVFFLREYDDVVVRVSREKLDADEQRAYHAEIETQRALARHGIAPRVFCVVRVVEGREAREARKAGRANGTERTDRREANGTDRREAEKAERAIGTDGRKANGMKANGTERTDRRTDRRKANGTDGRKVRKTGKPARLGYAMERFDLSLAEAIERGLLPSDGWSKRNKRAHVELFERAATLVRCVDTTASNVVVRWHESEEDSVDGSEVEFRLIDVDGYFCGRVGSEPESVRAAMRAWESGAVRASAGSYAALGLLVLCVHARLAWLARMLLRYEVGLVRLLADDAAAQTMVSARDRLVWTQAQVSAVHMVRAYSTRQVKAPHDVPGVLRAIASED
jgi:hypothetical protein